MCDGHCDPLEPLLLLSTKTKNTTRVAFSFDKKGMQEEFSPPVRKEYGQVLFVKGFEQERTVWVQGAAENSNSSPYLEACLKDCKSYTSELPVSEIMPHSEAQVCDGS